MNLPSPLRRRTAAISGRPSQSDSRRQHLGVLAHRGLNRLLNEFPGTPDPPRIYSWTPRGPSCAALGAALALKWDSRDFGQGRSRGGSADLSSLRTRPNLPPGRVEITRLAWQKAGNRSCRWRAVPRARVKSPRIYGWGGYVFSVFSPCRALPGQSTGLALL